MKSYVSKWFVVCAIALAAAILAVSLTACGESSNSHSGTSVAYEGTYYEYNAGVKDPGSWIKLSKSTWSDSEGESGRLELKSGVLYLYINLFGEEDVLAYGTVNQGVFAYTLGMESYDGQLIYYNYYKDGSPAADKDSSEYTQGGSSSGNQDPPPSTNKYTVSFDSKGGSAVADVLVNEGARLTAPSQPTRQMYVFAGWYKESACRNAWDFDTDVVTGNITLYAKWQADEVRVSTVDGATIDGNNIFLLVDDDVDDLDMNERVVLNSDTATWRLYFDKMGRDEIRTKIATNYDGTLDLGSNLFYIVVTSSDGTQSKSFVLDVYKKYAVPVYVCDVYDAVIDTYELITLEPFTAPAQYPSIPGYTVTGWRSTGLRLGADIPKDCESLRLYVEATPNDYTLTYDPNGGTLDQTTATVRYDGTVSLATPSREGYTFIGWAYNSALVPAEDGRYTWKIVSNATFLAQWQINSYRVQAYASDSGAGSVNVSGVDDDGYADYHSTVTLTASVNNGYNFVGWYLGDTCLSTDRRYSYVVPASFSSLTARYNYYTVTTETDLSGAGRYTQYTNQKVSVGDSVTLTASTYNGYTWVGWFDGDTKVSEGTSLSYSFDMPEENKTFTAKWIRCPVTLARNDTAAGYVSGVSGATAIGAETTVTATTYNGYTWVGWFDGDTKLSDELTYTFVMTEEIKTFTAKWAYYTVSTQTNLSGAGSYTQYSNRKTTVGASVTLTATTNNGYTWVGWFDGDTKVSDDSVYTFVMTEESKVFTATWCKVTLERNDNAAGSISKLNDKYVAGQEVTITATTNNGYTWVGWFDGDVKVSDDLVYSFVMPEESKTYTATWSKVTLQCNDPSAGSVTDLTDKYVAGQEVTITAHTTNGYTWVGWYDGDTKVSEGTSLTCTFNMPAENKLLIAKWIPCPITLECNDTLAGSLTGVEETVLGAETTITAATNNGYTWVGWYDGDSKVSEGASLSYTFVMSEESKVYQARWSKVTLQRNDTSGGSITELTDKYVVGQEVVITATTNIGYTWVGWYDGDSKVSEGASLSYTFVMTEESKTYTATWEIAQELSVFRYTTTATTCTITGIKEKAVKEIVVPDYVTEIGQGAFAGCSSLVSITIPFVGALAGKTADDTYQYPFGYIFGTTSYTGGTATTQSYYGSSVFSTTSTTYFIPSTLRSVTVTGGNILRGAFYGCSGLTSITIPDSVTSLGNYVFSDCTRLTSVTIPDNVTSIGDYAFQNCTGLTSVVIDNGVTSIGGSAFSGCSKLAAVTIGDSVTSIGSSAFRNCTGLTSITIPASVTSIGGSAFYACNNIAEIRFNGSMKDWCAISGLDSLMPYGKSTKSLYINNSLITGELTIPTDVESISASAFYICGKLTSVTIPVSVKTIGTDAFRGCDIGEIHYMGGITDWCAISGLSGLMSFRTKSLYINGTLVTALTIPNSVTSIGNYAFEKCSGLTSVTIPGTVTSVGNYAFSDCTELTSVAIGNGVTSIGDYAFSGCDKLTSVTIPASVTDIGNDAFKGCSRLTSVTIGKCVTSIGSYAFSGCYQLTSITIPDSVTTIGARAFYNCSGLTSLTIGKCVTSIGSSAFDGCKKLASVTIPDSVTSIGWGAFHGCSGLTSLTIGKCVTSIGDYAFSGCTGLTSVVIGNGVKSIGISAFSGCTGLTSVTIPASVTSIESCAFYGCSGLTSITFRGTKQQWNAISKGSDWNTNTGKYTIHCTDGNIAK